MSSRITSDHSIVHYGCAAALFNSIGEIDFDSLSENFVFNGGDSIVEMCFSNFITNDDISENCKNFTVSLSSEGAVIPVSSVDVVLYDDDGKIHIMSGYLSLSPPHSKYFMCSLSLPTRCGSLFH